ncbi:Histone deacetylase HOS3 [Purpureocillium lavendulum]|uniref:Histone deacetylase HOS3 n=1 Tax=Purpureocillium lavendulum TaxID=1247861 RepID=A0AB34FZU8_9HYPO|nr:Histone deacetylase HOS3 [Purpureocillium lavendulum]
MSSEAQRRILIIATARSDGKGKTKNTTPGQVHREDVMNHEDAFFYTNIVMSACVHGVWDLKNNDKTPATFLLFTCEIQSMREFRARKIKLQIDFRNVNNEEGGHPPANPTIVSRGPEIIERFQKVPVLHKRERGAKGAVEGGTVVKPGITLHQISSEEFERPYFAEAKSGVRHASSTDHRYVKVWWIYNENRKVSNGVAPGFRIAVLLKRANNSPFQGQFAITEFEAGWRYPAAVAWHDFWSERDPEAEEDKIIDPITFDPGEPGPVMPKWLSGVDDNQLVELQTETGIDKKFARVWGVDV